MYIGGSLWQSYDAYSADPGEPHDANGLQNHRARYYAPGLAVWTALDPWEGLYSRPMSLNGYSWVEGRVVNATDASGMCADPLTCALLFALGLAILAGCTTTPPTSVPTRQFNIDDRRAILASAVTIEAGPYNGSPDCTEESNVVCRNKRCESLAVRQGLGTIIGDYIVSHDHFGPGPTTPQMAVEAFQSDRRIDWVEFRGQMGTIHIPVDKLTPKPIGIMTAAFELPDDCAASDLGTPAVPAPFRAMGLTTTSEIFDRYRGSMIFHVYIEGANVGEPGVSSLQHYWHQLDVGMATLYSVDVPPAFLLTQLAEGDERLADGDSGGGSFMIIDNRAYFIGVNQAVRGIRPQWISVLPFFG